MFAEIVLRCLAIVSCHMHSYYVMSHTHWFVYKDGWHLCHLCRLWRDDMKAGYQVGGGGGAHWKLCRDMCCACA